MCSHVFLGASSLDGAMGGTHERETHGKRLVWEATSWKKGGGPAGTVFREKKDLGTKVPSWQVLGMGDGRMISCEGYLPKRRQKDIAQARQRSSVAKVGREA